MRTEQEQRAWESHAAELNQKLLRILESRTQSSGLSYAAAPAPLGGGYWASLYGFRLAKAPRELSGDLVLRVLPTSDENALREATIQAAVAAAGFPAPRVHLSAGREAGLGFPFIVMDRMAGRASVNVSALGEAMAALHALDPAPVCAALAKAGVKSEEVMEGLPVRAGMLTDGGFASGLDWLKKNRPRGGADAVCHGDLHPYNVMIVGGRVSGVLDWTQALIAEPAYDVAYTSQLLALWPLEMRGVPRPLGRLIGRLAAWRFVRAYRARAKARLDHVEWYEALHAFRVLVRVALARAGHTVPPLADDHPWELVADDAARAFERRTGVAIRLPRR